MKVVKNYLYNASYQLFLILVPLITTPYISRVLGPEGVGINAYTNSIIQYFVLFGSIGINLYGNREIAYHRDDPAKLTKTFWEIESLRIIAILGAIVIFMGYLAIVHKYHNYLVMQSFQLIAAAFDISWFFMGTEDFRTTVLRNMLVKILSVVLIFSFVKTASDTALYILIIGASQLVGNITLWPYLRKRLVPGMFHHLNIWRHFRPALVLFVPQVATQIYLVLNKTMLGQFDSVTAAGFFDNSDKIVKMVLAVVTATGTVMLPRVAHTFAQGNMKKVNSYLYTTFDFVTFASIPMMFGLAAIAPKFATWFFGPKFAATSTLLMCEAPVILFIAWSNAIGTQYLLPTNHNREYTVSVTIGAVVNLLLNIPLIIKWGAVGAAISTVVSEASVAFYQLYVIRKQASLSRLFTSFWKYLLAGVVMFAVVFAMNLHLPFGAVNLVLEVGVGIVIYGLFMVILRPKIMTTVKDFVGSRRK
ncbi:flippase [Loigolactobacillus backii]|uniref:flippase n=1 Tax=Loigolactobacillus backii TaxID=375175 RepID=UPI000C1CB897|nr:flippase [Loigolactobacillus backii]MDA5387325.1 flippase [Loigolactobacillus backii]MDA5389864.1 flippase [Loigolactobacillus backii]PIO83060.1 hypothetical protein BSQ39_05460 [Loigolactobacillus backii]